MAQNLREAVKAVFPTSRKWASKVDKMPEHQLVAVYMRLKLQGKVT